MSEQISMDDIFAVMDANAAKSPPKKKRKHARQAKKSTKSPPQKKSYYGTSDVKIPLGTDFVPTSTESIVDETDQLYKELDPISIAGFGTFRFRTKIVNIEYLDKDGKWKYGGYLYGTGVTKSKHILEKQGPDKATKYHHTHGSYQNHGFAAFSRALEQRIVQARRGRIEEALPQDD